MEKFYVLGTGAGVPDNCFSLSGVLKHNNQSLLVDTGGGVTILKQLRLLGLKRKEIHNVFISHKHIDHLLGIIPFLRRIIFDARQGEYDGVLRIYCHSEIKEIIDYIINATFYDVYIDLYKKMVIYNFLEDEQEYDIIGYKMKVVDTHFKKLPQFGFEINLENNRKLFYLGDVPCAKENYDKILNADWVFHEVYNTSKQEMSTTLVRKTHSTVGDVCTIMNKLNVKNLMLWHSYDTEIETRKERFLAEGKKIYKGNLYVPDDLDVIDLD